MTSWPELESQVFFHVAKRSPVVAVRGEGSRLWDENGKEYLDLIAGWAVNTLGHCHPVMVEALTNQAQQLIHTSNQFYTIPQLELAKLLVDHSPLDRAFLGNSGAEANEGAIKLARKWGKRHRGGAYGVITTLGSFHGRTLAMVAATGKPAYQEPFRPLPDGFVNVPFNDLEAIKAATNETTVAVMLEPVQGEGGVNVPSEDYLQQVRAWCDAKNLLFIADEVQTGIGRLGTLWGHTQFGVEPDIMTVAKGLGGGVAVGGFLATERVSVL
ncbi:MAG: aminotransferase class III-fold pyridoxal phosphate-dependent enzyme, partial [Chloroflexi bacterium]|nr:aminotransferase class III-fold pyridoxal phosphate-dependent enzyme [Chloroflexota bacterium]